MSKKGKKDQATYQSRRKFLKLNWSSHSIQKKIAPELENKKQKMLMADGTLVEIDLSKLGDNAFKKKASNREILEWMTGPNKSQKNK